MIKNVDKYTDKEIVEAILHNDSKMIEYFFCEKCSKMLSYIAMSMFDNRVDRRELISELIIYLADDGWRKLTQFDFRSSLMTWMSVVSVRFFQKKRKDLIENDSSEALLQENISFYNPSLSKEQKMDLNNALNRMKNQRYHDVIVALDIEDLKPETVAGNLSITVDNLYNLHRRALIQLRSLLGRKEDFYV